MVVRWLTDGGSTWKIVHVTECDQDIPQSQNADKAMAPRGRATQKSQDTTCRKTNLAKQPVLSSQSR